MSKYVRHQAILGQLSRWAVLKKLPHGHFNVRVENGQARAYAAAQVLQAQDLMAQLNATATLELKISGNVALVCYYYQRDVIIEPRLGAVAYDEPTYTSTTRTFPFMWQSALKVATDISHANIRALNGALNRGNHDSRCCGWPVSTRRIIDSGGCLAGSFMFGSRPGCVHQTNPTMDGVKLTCVMTGTGCREQDQCSIINQLGTSYRFFC